MISIFTKIRYHVLFEKKLTALNILNIMVFLRPSQGEGESLLVVEISTTIMKYEKKKEKHQILLGNHCNKNHG